MLCQCRTSSNSTLAQLKKPSRPPPPPPVPPRHPSPAQSTSSLNQRYSYNGADSECCSEGGIYSVKSVPYTTRSFQPTRSSYSVTANQYNSAKSECGYSCRTSEYCSPCCSGICQYAASCCETQSQVSVESSPPAPRQRVFRPRLSISPKPMLKTTGKNNNNDYRMRPRYRCKSLNYRLHMELHVERVDKYLRDRQIRLNQFESDIVARRVKPQEESSLRKMLAVKETRHLRSLRARLGPNDFKIIKELGAGFIGNVFLVLKLDSGDSLMSQQPDRTNLFAMKRLKKSQVEQQNHTAHIMAERDILAEADNEWIVKLFYSFQDDLYLYFILEYAPGGDMMSLLCTYNVFPEDWARFYIAEISLALQFVHDMNFIHRDIKPDNILIDRNGHIKLTDFGLCTGFRWNHDKSYYSENESLVDNMNHYDDHPTITKELTAREIEHSNKRQALSLVGSTNYIAPEVLRQDSADERSLCALCDWWSVGVILYEMVVGYCPFIDIAKLKTGEYNPKNDTKDKIQWRIINWRYHLAFPDKSDPNSPPSTKDHRDIERPLSEETKSLIRGLLCDPHDRLCRNGLSDIQNHSFFKGIDWQRIRSQPAPFVPELDNELDTRYFDQVFYPHEIEATLGASSGSRMPMNGFTYRCFWRKPPNEFE